LLKNIPPRNTSVSLARDLFPAGSELKEIYGKGVSPRSILFLKSSEALVRFNSKQHADEVLISGLVDRRTCEVSITAFDCLGLINYPLSNTKKLLTVVDDVFLCYTLSPAKKFP
jgi:hypothetical protein